MTEQERRALKVLIRELGTALDILLAFDKTLCRAVAELESDLHQFSVTLQRGAAAVRQLPRPDALATAPSVKRKQVKR